MRRTICFAALAALALSVPVSCGEKEKKMPWDDDIKKKDDPQEQKEDLKVGDRLPLWSEGCLDIHAINTGRGECTFVIMPDGTTMCIDAGEIGLTASQPMVAQRPNKDTRAYTTYARYIQHFLPEASKGRLDYMQLSHFHNDHYGTMSESGYAKDSKGGYTISGLTGLYSIVRFDKLVDRIYPDYDEVDNASNPSEAGKWKGKASDYCKFVDYNMKNGGLKVEKFKIGSTEQLGPCRNASKYPDFKVLNVCANGRVISGTGEKDTFGSAQLTENGASCGMLISYGKFDYLTCGDGGQNGKVENPLAQSLNKHVEAMKAHHHMSTGTMTTTAMAIYRPQVIVTQSFYIRPDEQPHPVTLGNLLSTDSYVGGKNLYFTNIDASVPVIHPELYNRDECRSFGGHVVIRVLPGGESYNVYVLDDTVSDYIITRIDGPFNCN